MEMLAEIDQQMKITLKEKDPFKTETETKLELQTKRQTILITSF